MDDIFADAADLAAQLVGEDILYNDSVEPFSVVFDDMTNEIEGGRTRVVTDRIGVEAPYVHAPAFKKGDTITRIKTGIKYQVAEIPLLSSTGSVWYAKIIPCNLT
jgi:hypothetical protein